MSRPIILASFVQAEDLLEAVRAARQQGWEVIDVYTPYFVHELDETLGWRRSRLSVACFLGGAVGAAVAVWFQFWTTGWDWPLNVGGRPWNSLPAFVPAVFECMVLLAGLSLVFAWLGRCRLYPGKKAVLPLAGLTDDRFAVAVCDPGPAAGAEAVRQLFHDCRAIEIDPREEEDRP